MIMNEIQVNTAISLSARDILGYGMKDTLDTSAQALSQHIRESLMDMIMDDFKEQDYCFQFILTIKKL